MMIRVGRWERIQLAAAGDFGCFYIYHYIMVRGGVWNGTQSSLKLTIVHSACLLKCKDVV